MPMTIATEFSPTDECFDEWEFVKVVRGRDEFDLETVDRTELRYSFRDWTGIRSSYSAWDELMKTIGQAVMDGKIVERGDNTDFNKGGIWIQESEKEIIHYCWSRIKFEG